MHAHSHVLFYVCMQIMDDNQMWMLAFGGMIAIGAIAFIETLWKVDVERLARKEAEREVEVERLARKEAERKIEVERKEAARKIEEERLAHEMTKDELRRELISLTKIKIDTLSPSQCDKLGYLCKALGIDVPSLLTESK